MPSNHIYTSLPGSESSDNLPNSPFPEHPQSSHELIGDNHQNSNGYQESLDTPMDLPPAYEPSASFEQFEIEEPEDLRNTVNTSLRSKAGLLAQSFNRRIVQPINNALDPIYQLYCFTNAKFEYFIGKLGNPLIVKRVLYIFFVAIILYIASLSGLNSEKFVGSRSDFMDPLKLFEFIELSVDAKRLEENLEYLSSMPHLSGTTGDLALSRYFEQLILQSKLDMNPDIVFETYTNYPLDPKVQLIDNNDAIILECDLKETLDDGINNDFYKLAFNPGSKDMTSRGKLIYANYGTLKDYKLLEDNSIDINGSILIIKYGGYYPAFKKLRYAQEKGAVGVLFISDPELDDVYNLDSLQREPVAFTDKFPGNIIGSGVSAGTFVEHEGSLEDKLSNSAVLPSIPSLPIKWKDFITIMEKISNNGQRIESWDIKINDIQIPIWTGSEDFEILLQNSLTTRPFKESWNVVGKLQGSEQDTFAIIIGASRDSTCYGAMESSGSAILLELMNIFSAMSSSLFWRPLRTIYFVSFTGSKYNLAGSTYFTMKNSDFFKRDVYAYIDLDDIIQGNSLEFSSDPLFSNLIGSSINALMNSNSSHTMIDYDMTKPMNYRLNPLSNGFPMTEHDNVGSISIKLTDDKNKLFNTPRYPKNSCLDTFANFKDKQIDPDMSKHTFMTKLISFLTVKLVDTPILPYDLRSMFDLIINNIKDLKQYSNFKNQFLNFGDLDQMMNRIIIISEQNEAFVQTWNDIVDNGYGSEPNLLSVNRWDWNAKLLLLNKVMIEIDGTFENPFNHNIFFGIESNPELRDDDNNAPKTGFPGVWDAIDKNDWQHAQEQIDIVTDMLNRCLNLFQY
jgi:N-acetylated-alpha-linked acidic dipeptidase